MTPRTFTERRPHGGRLLLAAVALGVLFVAARANPAAACTPPEAFPQCTTTTTAPDETTTTTTPVETTTTTAPDETTTTTAPPSTTTTPPPSSPPADPPPGELPRTGNGDGLKVTALAGGELGGRSGGR